MKGNSKRQGLPMKRDQEMAKRTERQDTLCLRLASCVQMKFKNIVQLKISSTEENVCFLIFFWLE